MPDFIVIAQALAAMTVQPIDCAASTRQHHGYSEPCFIRSDGRPEQPAIDAIVGMRVVPPNDLAAGKCTDRRADEHIARPMLVVVHPRARDAGRAPVHRDAHQPLILWPPSAGLGGDCRCGRESRERMAGWE